MRTKSRTTPLGESLSHFCRQLELPHHRSADPLAEGPGPAAVQRPPLRALRRAPRDRPVPAKTASSGAP
nr:hypothetical protein [Kineococcus radiotolerans]